MRDVEKHRERTRAWLKANPERRKARRKAWNKANPERVTAMKRKERYGISRAEQEALFAQQGGKCAVCDTVLTFRQAHLDHNHSTGQIRGFLCRACNLTVGNAQEDPIRLERAAAYLRAWPEAVKSARVESADVCSLTGGESCGA